MEARPDTIAEALFGHTRRRLLALFFGRPGESFYARQIVRETGAGTGAVQRELRRLVGAGLLVRTPSGNQVHYAANRESPVYAELRGLLQKTAGIADVVRRELQRFARTGKIELAFLYGSMAGGRQGARSDVDVMVVGDVTMRDLIPVLRPLQARLGRDVNATVYDSAEFRSKVKGRDHFIGRVLEQPRIMLVGSGDDLKKLARKPLARGA